MHSHKPHRAQPERPADSHPTANTPYYIFPHIWGRSAEAIFGVMIPCYIAIYDLDSLHIDLTFYNVQEII